MRLDRHFYRALDRRGQWTVTEHKRIDSFFFFFSLSFSFSCLSSFFSLPVENEDI